MTPGDATAHPAGRCRTLTESRLGWPPADIMRSTSIQANSPDGNRQYAKRVEGVVRKTIHGGGQAQIAEWTGTQSTKQ